MNCKTIRGITDVVHPRVDEGNNDKAYRDDIALPRLAQIIRRYDCIPTTDGYIEKWGDQVSPQKIVFCGEEIENVGFVMVFWPCQQAY